MTHAPPEGVGPDAADPIGFDPEAVLARDPRVLLDPTFLCALRVELFGSLSPEQAGTVLLRMGFLLGLRDALRALAGVSGSDGNRTCRPPLVMRCHGVTVDAAFEVRGNWPERREATARLQAGEVRRPRRLRPERGLHVRLALGHVRGRSPGDRDGL
jgi:hypothetical protein